MLIAANTCCCGGDVLIWSTIGFPFAGLQAVYEGMGLVVHNQFNWNRSLSSYRLIFLVLPNTDTIWWPQISGGTWHGRIVIMVDSPSGGVPAALAFDYVNTKSGLTGVSLINGAYDAGLPAHDGTAEPNALTVGQTTIKYALTCEVSGGSILSKTVTGSHPWLTRNKPGTSIDFVISGDGDFVSDAEPAIVAHNTPLIQNLWNVAV